MSFHNVFIIQDMDDSNVFQVCIVLKIYIRKGSFVKKYIWFEKVASWHDVRLHKDHSLELVCSIISQSLSYASECMRIDVASLKVIFKEECLSFYKKFSKDEFLMSSKDKTLVKLWFVICNHNMKGIFLSETSRIQTIIIICILEYKHEKFLHIV